MTRMRIRISIFVFVLIGSISIWSGCRRDNALLDIIASEYPENIGKIMLTKCAVSGCHNTISKDAVAGLDLSSWTKMMEGDRNGAVVIPYAHGYSTLFMFTNTFSDLGPSTSPSMPLNQDPLTREEVTQLRDWINAGAPNREGFVKWSDNPNRNKFYVTNQGCDVVTSIDAVTHLPMRYIPVGAEASIESPHMIKISPDGQYWYVSFIAGQYLEKHRTSDDALVGRILLGPNAGAAIGSWNTFAISSDGRYAYVVDWNPNGRIARVDLENMVWLQTYQGQGYLIQPHGSFLTPDDQVLYVTTTSGNFVYRIDISIPQLPDKSEVVINGDGFVSNVSSEDGHDLIFSPDGTKYFITCQKSNTIRVMSTAADTLLATIPVGLYPQELAISETRPYLYVTCMEDTITYPGNRGLVAVINWQTNTLITTVNTGFQPHGVALDDDRGLVIISNRNVQPGGPAPHHSNACGGRNGYFTLIDMNTNTLISGSKNELAVDPYSCVYRR
jgi:YVTN family beta-propeller protein